MPGASRTTNGRATPLFVAGVATAALLSLVAYGRGLGAGFQSDDFRWLWHARFSGWADLTRIFAETLGFYRPFTQLLWTFDLLRAGPDPGAFAVTNLVLHVLVLALFATLARRLLRHDGAAVAATLLAALSHHYNNMAVLWISGRGALLGAAAALVALWLWDRWCRREGGGGTWMAACAAMAVGLGSYEAVAGVPLLMAAMIPYRSRGTRSLWAAAGPLALWLPYGWIRVVVGARQPWGPGAGYAYGAGAMLPNLLEYTGRAVMTSLVFVMVVAVAALAARRFGAAARGALRGARPIGAFAATWFIVGLLPALPVGSRSSLYVYFAALGLHLIFGAALAGAVEVLWRQRRAAGVLAVAAMGLLALAVWPAFAWDRNRPFVDQARLSMSVIADIRAAVPAPDAGECVILLDDRDARPNLRQALSGDLFWLGAFIYDEEPSERVRYAGDADDPACARPHLLRLQPDGDHALRVEGVR